jgi:hypothetical protein
MPSRPQIKKQKFSRRQKSYRRFLKQKRLDFCIVKKVIFKKRTEDVKRELYEHAIDNPQKRTKGQSLESLATDRDCVEAQEQVLCKGFSLKLSI